MPKKPTKPKKPARGAPVALRNKPVRERPLTDAGAAFVHAMVWKGLSRNLAAVDAGISVDYATRLLKSPEVMTLYQTELAALRESQKSRATHRLAELAEQDENQTAAVAAAKTLLSFGEKEGRTVNVSVNVTPGYVIDPTKAFSRKPQMIDAEVIRSHPLPLAGRVELKRGGAE